VKNGSIKRLTAYLLGMLFFLTACGPREIPDQDMEGIIHDIFLVNAYVGQYQMGKIGTDSVDIYEPILEKYGYDAEDFRYSMERMTLKKSSRLAELIDKATADIKAENDFYEARARIAERVDTLIGDFYRDTVLQRVEPFWVRNPRDRDSLRILTAAEAGKYRVKYGYLIDSTDKSSYLSMRYNLKDSTGRNIYNNSRGLTRDTVRRDMDVTFDANERACSLELILAHYSDNIKNIGIRIDSLFVLHEPPLDSTRTRYWRDRFGSYTARPYPPRYETEKDSSTLYLMPPHRPEPAGRTEL